MRKDLIKDEHFVAIQGWMINRLDLKGSELFIYACINGFSQGGQGCFNGSLAYLAAWCNCSKRNVINALASLCSKGLIEKKEMYINNVKQCEYRVIEREKISLGGEKISLGGEKISLGGGEKISLGGGEKISPNNINNKNIDINNIVCSNLPIFDKIVHTYNNICKSLKHAKKMTPKRKEAIEKILKIYTYDQLVDIFKKAEQSEYCKGSREGWKAGFDWLMNEDNIVKLLEGNYDKMHSKRKEQIPSWMNKNQQVYDFENLEKELTGSGKTVSNDTELKERAEKLKKKIAAG